MPVGLEHRVDDLLHDISSHDKGEPLVTLQKVLVSRVLDHGPSVPMGSLRADDT